MWRPRSKKGGSIKARRPFPFAFLQFLNSIFDIYSLSTFPPLSTNLSKKKKKRFQGASCTFLLLYLFLSFWKRVLQSALQCYVLFSEYRFHIHVFQNHNVGWEKKPTIESDVILPFLLCCVSFPSLLPFPCKEL